MGARHVGEEDYYKIIENMIPNFLSPSKVHKRIFDINPHIIITTNWDSIFERAKQEYAQFYDVVSTDRELVKSVFHHKIIKMHGDFPHKNIVFKEDDYLNYEKNFPLISNYIKSILSTHTVLFLGYSYNDINLKLIIQWLRNNAEQRPDMFLTAFDSNSNQIRYLRDHGIETIILSDINNNLVGINDLDQCSRMMYTFLDKLFKGYDPIDLKKFENIVQFIYNKIKPLENLNGILVDQIQKLLTNCGFVYDFDTYAILQFYNSLLTEDYNREIRDIYAKFVDLLNYIVNGEKPSAMVLDIFSILIKAGIKGIILEKDDLKNCKHAINFSSFLNQEINVFNSNNFDFAFHNYLLNSDNVDILLDSAFKLYNLNKIEDAYNLTEKIIDITVSANDHVKLFITLFNRNILLKSLKYNRKYANKYTNIENYNIASSYNNLTDQLKVAVDPVYDFINFSEIYKNLHTSIYDLDKIKKYKRSIDSGGFVYTEEIYKYLGRHINLINFVLSNKIMVEDFSEFKKTNRNFIEIALLRQTQDDNAILIRPELYSCIKYLNFDELKSLFQEYYKENSKKIGTFQLNDEDTNWFINIVFKNCIDQYLTDDVSRTLFEEYIEKILFLLSIIKLTDDDVQNIFNMIDKLISEKSNSIILFQLINLFIGLQYKLHKTRIEKQIFVDIIEALVNKIINKKISRNEIIVNYLSNLYGYASVEDVIFENDDIVNKLLASLVEYHTEFKLDIIQNFILNIYQISNDSIKSIIKNYISQFIVNDEIPIGKRISFNNNLIILGLKDFTRENLDEIQAFVDTYTKENIFDSFLNTLIAQIDYMITKMDLKELEDVSEKIKNSISKYNEYENRSVF